MGAQDTSTRDYVNEADIFSDAYNYLMYDGEPELEAGMLRPLDTSLYMKIFGSSDFKNDIEKAQDTIRKSEKTNSRKKRQKSVKRDPYESVQRYRDAVRLASAKTDGHFTYIILGLEAQTHVHYAMCIRNLIYDGLQYARQVEELRLKHRLAGDTDIPDEFLSGMKKNDRLLPVITLVIHFAPEPWDGALSLKELLDIPDERIQPFIQDYKVFLIDPARMDDDEFKKFSTNLGDALKFMKYSANDIKMEELIKGDAFKKLDRKAAQVIKDCANIDIEIKPNQEVINMCKAWDDHAKKVAAQAVKEANQKNEEHNKKLCKAWEDHAKRVVAQAVEEANQKNEEHNKKLCKAWEDHAKRVAAQAVMEANQKNEEQNKQLFKAWEVRAKKVAAQAVEEANQKNEEHNKKLCKAWEDHAKKVAEQAVMEATEKNNKAWENRTKKIEVISAIETARRFGIKDEAILNDIISRFQLPYTEAVDYMEKNSA